MARTPGDWLPSPGSEAAIVMRGMLPLARSHDHIVDKCPILFLDQCVKSEPALLEGSQASYVVRREDAEYRVGPLLREAKVNQQGDCLSSVTPALELLLTNCNIDSSEVLPRELVDDSLQVHTLEPALADGMSLQLDDEAVGVGGHPAVD